MPKDKKKYITVQVAKFGTGKKKKYSPVPVEPFINNSSDNLRPFSINYPIEGKPREQWELDPVTIHSFKNKNTRDFYNTIREGNEDAYQALISLGEKYGFPNVTMVPKKHPVASADYNSSDNSINIYDSQRFINNKNVNDQYLLRQYIEELSHHIQYTKPEEGYGSPVLRKVRNDLPARIFGKIYIILQNTLENQAHSVIYPKIRNEFDWRYDTESNFDRINDYYQKYQKESVNKGRIPENIYEYYKNNYDILDFKYGGKAQYGDDNISLSSDFYDLFSTALQQDPSSYQFEREGEYYDQVDSENEYDYDYNELYKLYEDQLLQNETLNSQLKDYELQSQDTQQYAISDYPEDDPNFGIDFIIKNVFEAPDVEPVYGEDRVNQLLTEPSYAEANFKTKSNSVNISNLDSRIIDYINNELPQDLRDQILVTSGNDDKHTKGSKHYSNQAIDLRFNSNLHNYIANDPKAKKYGLSVLDPNHGTAKHTHLQVK